MLNELNQLDAGRIAEIEVDPSVIEIHFLTGAALTAESGHKCYDKALRVLELGKYYSICSGLCT